MSGEAASVTLANLGRGGLEEKYGMALKRVLANIADPNTSLAAREINIKIKIVPDDNRKAATVDVQCTEKLAPPKGMRTQFFIGRGAEGPMAVENNPDQQLLFGDGKPAMREVKGAKS